MPENNFNDISGLLLYAELTYDDVACLTNTCSILTPLGYKNVSDIIVGDIVSTHKNKPVVVTEIYKKTLPITKNTLPYKIPKNYFGKNKPTKNTYITKNHMFMHNNKWNKPENTKFIQEWKTNTITLYNLKLSNYHTDTLVVNGLTMESWDGLDPQIPRNYVWKKQNNTYIKKIIK